MPKASKEELKPGYILVFDNPIIWKRTLEDGSIQSRRVYKVCTVLRRIKGKSVIRFLTEFNVVMNIQDIGRRSYRRF